ncbi:MAG: hypothetical protein LPK45_03595 [Bacteroidota bacterium]|nr:hypothetical protein [Bacteroidota bacterium]MDX5430135.1 hypothetical protein [Bacteroidota bacterium]MDX5468896.1 hypothetical protein [Bacteroidota bacterium]
MKWFGLFFMVVGVIFGVNWIEDAYEHVATQLASVVVEGEVVEVYDNRDTSGTHWRYHQVSLLVQYQTEEDSLKTVEEWCLYHSFREYEYFRCCGVGEKKMVRYIPNRNRNMAPNPDFIQVTDSGEFLAHGFSWFTILVSAAFLLIGRVFYGIGKHMVNPD